MESIKHQSGGEVKTDQEKHDVKAAKKTDPGNVSLDKKPEEGKRVVDKEKCDVNATSDEKDEKEKRDVNDVKAAKKTDPGNVSLDKKPEEGKHVVDQEKCDENATSDEKDEKDKKEKRDVNAKENPNEGKGQHKRDVTNEMEEKFDVNVAKEELNKRDVRKEMEQKCDVNVAEETPQMVNCDKEGSVIEITPQEQVTDIDHSEIVDLSG